MTKYNKAAVAAGCTAIFTIVEWAFNKDIPTAVEGAITTLAVLIVPNAAE